MKKWILFAVVALLLTGREEASAGPITYTEQFVGSGSLNGVSFTNAQVTITAPGDTSTVVNLGGGLFDNIVGTTTLNVSGFGPATFTDTIAVFDNHADSRAGFADTMSVDIMNTANAAFASYDLTTSIGPLSGSPAFNPNTFFPTTLGNFNVNSVSGDSTFTASTGDVVPEPATLTLLLTGALGMVAYGWRRRRTS